MCKTYDIKNITNIMILYLYSIYTYILLYKILCHILIYFMMYNDSICNKILIRILKIDITIN